MVTAKDVDELRRRHPRFVYRSSRVDRHGEDLRFSARFLLEPGLEFEPEVVIHGAPDTCPPDVLDNLAFHLGLAEIPSYWKAACPREIVVEAGPLEDEQRDWWKRLLANGLGEFVFVNDLGWDVVDGVRIEASGARPFEADGRSHRETDALVQIGGGKDSAVAAELMRRHTSRMGAMLLNSTRAARGVAAVAGADHVVVASRRIDPELLRLNAAGYLNGHTPFSAYLAFLGVACASVFGYGRVVVSAERSSNEGNAVHRGRTVNHQWSKSWEFERAFRAYAARYLSPNLDSFSLVRPLWELQVARMFAVMPRYHSTFRSCNRGMATDTWCGRCPKCLFVYALLHPFLEPAELVAIFGHDLFGREELSAVALDLIGARGHKPLECVGTYEESRTAFALGIERAAGRGRLPAILARLEPVLAQLPPTDPQEFLGGWNDVHAVPAELAAAIRAVLDGAAEVGSRGRTAAPS